MNKIIDSIIDYQAVLSHIPVDEDAQVVTREKFTLLLSGISVSRRAPGVLRPMGFEELYHCDTKENQELLKEHLKKMLDITDKESLLKMCYTMYADCMEYEQFMTFWKEAPMFDSEKMPEEAKEQFTKCKDMAARFYPFVKEKGFYAWDMNERIGLCRLAVAAGIITDEEFWQITDEWVRTALVFFNSFAEYAMSCICGAVYYMSKFQEKEEELEKFYELTKTILDELLAPEGPWIKNRWYVPEKREIAALIPMNLGCIVSKDAIAQSGIGYMRRATPIEGQPDSGWRFFAKTEDEARIKDDNIVVCNLNTMCNLQPDLMAYIYAAPGKRYKKYDGSWDEEED